jgi:hypothetical protein
MIARWKGGAWQPLGSGVGSTVRALAVHNGELIAGGQLTAAGGKGSAYWARWSDAPTSPTISSQPADLIACPSGSAVFSVGAAGTWPFTYSWRKGGVPIDPLANPSGATDTLTLSHVSGADAGSYDCVVSNGCGGVTSDPAFLAVCPADFNCDGFVMGDDYTAFINAFEAGDLSADFNGDGLVMGDDYTGFINAFEGGC